MVYSNLAKIVNNIAEINLDIGILEKHPYDITRINNCIHKLKQIHADLVIGGEAAMLDSVFQECVDKLNQLINGLNNPQAQILREEEDIIKGKYQKEVMFFTQFLGTCPENEGNYRLTMNSFEMGVDKKQYLLYPMMDQPGFRVTASVPKTIISYPIEIQLNFFGTCDFASQLADLEKGGPGQETLKKHEKELLQKVNDMLRQVSEQYPDAPLRLRVAGHSLGGALAKGFTHSLQRACAVQVDSPQAIVDTIETQVAEFDTTASAFKANKKNLLKQLNSDAKQFKDLPALKKISGITVYSLGGPGVSEQTDKNATLLTYYQAPNFLRVYNHYHQEDIIPKFGDTEFLSGKHGLPQVLVHKAIAYDFEIPPEEIIKYPGLPFPGITSRVHAAHCMAIYNQKNVQHKITNLIECKELKEKFVFSWFRRVLYDIAFFFAKILASVKWIVKRHPNLASYLSRDLQNHEIERPLGQCFEPLALPELAENKQCFDFRNISQQKAGSKIGVFFKPSMVSSQQQNKENILESDAASDEEAEVLYSSNKKDVIFDEYDLENMNSYGA